MSIQFHIGKQMVAEWRRIQQTAELMKTNEIAYHYQLGRLDGLLAAALIVFGRTWVDANLTGDAPQ